MSFYSVKSENVYIQGFHLLPYFIPKDSLFPNSNGLDPRSVASMTGSRLISIPRLLRCSLRRVFASPVEVSITKGSPSET